MEKRYKMPAITWLKVTDYMHAWLQYELGGTLRIGGQLVLSIQHLPGAREVLRMETVEDMLEQCPVGKSMSDTWKNCIQDGLDLDPDIVEKMYGVNKNSLKLFMPIECPKLCLTKNGVMRPWTLDVNFGKRQAKALQDLLRNEFWNGVMKYNDAYAKKLGGKWYPAVDMIEEFCADTKTPDLYVEAMRREWQRRVKRTKRDD